MLYNKPKNTFGPKPTKLFAKSMRVSRFSEGLHPLRGRYIAASAKNPNDQRNGQRLKAFFQVRAGKDKGKWTFYPFKKPEPGKLIHEQSNSFKLLQAVFGQDPAGLDYPNLDLLFADLEIRLQNFRCIARVVTVKTDWEGKRKPRKSWYNRVKNFIPENVINEIEENLENKGR